MKKIFIVLLLSVFVLNAQQPVVLQPWMEVEGTVLGERLGSSVGFAGNIFDSTIISVGKVNETFLYHIKSPNDTTPRLILPDSNCSYGDFNGDGIKDLLVSGKPTKIYLGISPGEFDTTAFFVKNQEPDGYAFGRVAVGKINGDIYDDLVITDAGYPGINYFIGRAYIFLGGTVMDTLPKYVLNGDTIGVTFGLRVVLGDLNNDGYDDIIIRGYDSNNPISSQRFAYIKIFLGGNVVDTIAWKYIEGTNNSSGDVASFDVNGDGIADLLWGNIDSSSTVYIHYGASEGIDSIPNLKLNNPGVGGLGDRIVSGGDLNGDGYEDIVIGAPGHSQDLGFVLVYSGGPMIDNNFDAGAGLAVQSRFGQSVVSIGDVSGDGINDILVGAPRFKWNEYRGKWFILLGDTTIPVTSVNEIENTIQPKDFTLFQNYPNPFNPRTVIGYQLSVTGNVQITIYDILGKEITTLVDEEKFSGEYATEFDAKKYNLSSGIYYYKFTLTDLKGNKQTQTKSMVLIK